MAKATGREVQVLRPSRSVVNMPEGVDSGKVIRHVVSVSARVVKEGPAKGTIEVVISHDNIILGSLTFYDGMPNIDQNFAWYEVEEDL